MTQTELAPCVHPDVIIDGDYTIAALPTSRGLEVWMWLTREGGPSPLDEPIEIFPLGDWPRFFAHSSGILIGYKTSDDNILTVANVTTGIVTRTGIPALWNSPICWQEDGLLCVQAVNDPIGVWGGMWPARPAPPVIRQGVGTGLAQWRADGELWTWDEMNRMSQADGVTQMIDDNLDRFSVAQGGQGGIWVAFHDAPDGYLAPFTNCNDPRVARAADGSLTIICWHQGSQGSTGTTLYQGVTSADLIIDPQPALPSVEDVVPFEGQRALGAFDFGL